jgi:hypothetical protein
MIASELTSVIAENCPEYDPHYAHTLIEMSAMAGNCNSCANFAKGKCMKNLLDEIKNQLVRN